MEKTFRTAGTIIVYKAEKRETRDWGYIYKMTKSRGSLLYLAFLLHSLEYKIWLESGFESSDDLRT